MSKKTHADRVLRSRRKRAERGELEVVTVKWGAVRPEQLSLFRCSTCGCSVSEKAQACDCPCHWAFR